MYKDVAKHEKTHGATKTNKELLDDFSLFIGAIGHKHIWGQYDWDPRAIASEILSCYEIKMKEGSDNVDNC